MLQGKNPTGEDCGRASKEERWTPSLFGHMWNKKIGIRTGIADLKRDDGTTTGIDEEKAQLLNDFFQSVFTEEPEGELPEALEITYEKPLTDMDIKTEVVKKTTHKPQK